MTARRPTVSDLAQAVQAALTRDGGDEAEALRSALELVPLCDAASADERLRLLSDAPRPTGDPRYDALLAALVEHLCARYALPVPAWVDDPGCFLDRWWFVSGLRSLHATALVDSPISFARRGVFICAGALDYA